MLPLSGASRFLAWLFFLSWKVFMYLLYADDSGVSSDPNVKCSVLAGFLTFENQTFWIQKAVDEIMLKHIGRSDLELHTSPIKSGKGVWRGFPKDKREAILKDILNYIKRELS